MPISRREIDKACEYAMSLNISNERSGKVVRVGSDADGTSVLVIWTKRSPEEFETRKFVELMKETSARLGHPVEF